LILLPFLDRGSERYPLGRSRRWLTAAFVTIGICVISLTVAGLRDRPPAGEEIGLLSIAGQQLAESSGCQRCHAPGGAASSLAAIRLTRDDEWLLAHLADPIVIAPGVRPDSDPAPKPTLTRFQSQAVLAFLRRQYAGEAIVVAASHVTVAADVYASVCVACHKIGNDGGSVGPNLTHVGSRRDQETIRQIIEDPLSNYDESEMPPFGEKLTKEQINALAKYLASLR
jgi:mono/diheme cytochrome c family protein